MSLIFPAAVRATTNPVGAVGVVPSRAEFDGEDAADAPQPLTALTVNVGVLPLESPVALFATVKFEAVAAAVPTNVPASV